MIDGALWANIPVSPAVPVSLEQQTILMKYHAIFVIFEKAAKFEIVVCCNWKMALHGLTYQFLNHHCSILSFLIFKKHKV